MGSGSGRGYYGDYPERSWADVNSDGRSDFDDEDFFLKCAVESLNGLGELGDQFIRRLTRIRMRHRQIFDRSPGADLIEQSGHPARLGPYLRHAAYGPFDEGNQDFDLEKISNPGQDNGDPPAMGEMGQAFQERHQPDPGTCVLHHFAQGFDRRAVRSRLGRLQDQKSGAHGDLAAVHHFHPAWKMFRGDTG